VVRFVIEFDETGDNYINFTGLPAIVSGSHWLSYGIYSGSSGFPPAGWETVNFDDSAWAEARAPYPSPTQPSSLIPGSNAEHMWHDPAHSSDGTNGSVQALFRKTFYLNLTGESRPYVGKAKISVDDDYDLYVNGDLVFQNHDNGNADVVDVVDLTPNLQNGKNVIAIHAVDGGWDNPRDRIYERVLFDAKIHPLSDLFVLTNTPQGPGGIYRYEGKAGALIGLFGGGCDPRAMDFGPDGQFYIAYRDIGTFGSCVPESIVKRFEGRTGDFREFDDLHANYIPKDNQRFLFGVGGMAFGPDGNLYLTDPEDNSIHRYQGPFGENPGDFIDTFVASSSGGLADPQTLRFGTDGDIYVVSGNSRDRILHFQGPLGGQPGQFAGIFVDAGSGGLTSIADMIFGPDGYLYVSSRGILAAPGSILRFQGPANDQPGSFIDTFIVGGNGGFAFSADGLAFSPAEDLYVTGRLAFTNRVFRYSGQTGELLGVFTSVQDQPGPILFSAIADPANDLGDFNNDGCVDRTDLIQELLPAIRSGANDPNFDLSGDGLVNIADARKLTLLFTNPRGGSCRR